jgi:V/A-type H+-transporting ATPase subunit A
MREMSGRLEEIPGEEAFPAYLESVIASFYERAGVVRLSNGEQGSVTIGGTVSPAGGNFEEPVTQGTLKVVGAFHGLTRERSDARKYPAIHPLDSWSKYNGIVDPTKTEYARSILFRGNEVGQMMKVVGEEGTSLDDYMMYLKQDFLDDVYLQQNSFDPVDAAVSPTRQRHIFEIIFQVLGGEFDVESKEDARTYFNRLRQAFLDYNGKVWDTPEFKKAEKEVISIMEEKKTGLEPQATKILETAGKGE